jgi:hypothetical protein
LKFENKVDDHVMLFTAVGINDLQNGPCHALFGLLPGYKPFSVTAKVSAGPAAGVGGGDSAVMKPTSAALQDELMQAAGLKNLVMFNMSVLENLIPGNSQTIGSHAVQHVLGGIDVSSPMFASVFASPNVLKALMGLSFGQAHLLTYPKDATSKVSAVSFLWSVGFGKDDPNATLTNKIIGEALVMTFRWLDHIAGKLDRGYGGSRGW